MSGGPLERRASKLVAAGRTDEALQGLYARLRSHPGGDELRDLASALATTYSSTLRSRQADRSQRRLALSCWLMAGDPRSALRLSKGLSLDAARCHRALGEHDKEGQCYIEGGWPAHGAFAMERVGDLEAARTLWERVIEDTQGNSYIRGLAFFNLHRVLRGLEDQEGAALAASSCFQNLEAAAAGFERSRLRERAFDCYLVLLRAGAEGSFENLAEGYVGALRVLAADGLRNFVLQYFADFQEEALRRGEFHAAAAAFREGAQYCRRHGLPYADHFLRQGARAHRAAGDALARMEGQAELAENAYAASLELHAELGLFPEVEALYARLAELPLPDARIARYRRLGARLAGVPEATGAVFVEVPTHLRNEQAYPDVWRLDILEWEQKGDPAEAMGDIAFSSEWPDNVRSKAFACRLLAHEAEASPAVEQTVAVARALGGSDVYGALAPLEHLYATDQVPVRIACLEATQELFFKRTFGLVRRGLEDPDGQVRNRALGALKRLHFNHACDSLTRIYGESTDPETRLTALSSLGRIATEDAVDVLIEASRHGSRRERELARECLGKHTRSELVARIRSATASP